MSRSTFKKNILNNIDIMAISIVIVMLLMGIMLVVIEIRGIYWENRYKELNKKHLEFVKECSEKIKTIENAFEKHQIALVKKEQ
jgi:hypothetical protein